MSTREEILKELGITPIWKLSKGSYATTSVETRDSVSSQLLLKTGALAKAGQLSKGLVGKGESSVLLESGSHVVLGSGDRQAEWLFVGETQGVEESLSGDSFSGEAGKLFDNMLSAIHLRRNDKVYLLSVVQRRIPNDQEPGHQESVSCADFLEQQVRSIQPSVIVVLGNLAAERLIGLDRDFSDYRQMTYKCWGVNLITTYHPQHLLDNPKDKADAWKDLCFAIDVMNRAERASAPVS